MDLVKAESNGSIGEFGWTGAAGQYTLIDPEKQLSVTYTQHVLNSTGEGDRIHTHFRNVIYSCID